MAGETGRRRLVLLFSVLAGFFLMHGLTAGGFGGCHGSPSAVMAMSEPESVSESMAASMDGAVSHPAGHEMPVSSPARAASPVAVETVTGPMPVIGAPDPMPGHDEAGGGCVPLRPEGLAGLFLALFLIVITPWRPRLPHVVWLIRPHWPNGPPRTGVQVLRTLNVSRT